MGRDATYEVTILGPDNAVETDDTKVTTADITASNARVIIQRIEGALALLEAVIGVVEADTTTADTVTIGIRNDVATAKIAIANAEAVVDAVDGNPQRFPNFGANFAVLVKFQSAAVEKIDDKTVSKVVTTTVSSKGESTVTITVKDGNEVGLNGFADLAIDESAGDSAVFMESNLKTYHAPVKNGTATAKIKGLAKSGPVRVMVTATFVELTLTGHATRLGPAYSIAAMTYSCATKIEGVTVDEADICKAEAGMKTADLTETSVFAPGDAFLIVGALKDSAENTAG